MADTTYSVALQDNVSPGLDKISKAYDKLDKQFEKGFKTSNAIDKVTRASAKITDKSTQSTVAQTTALSKLDKVLGMFSAPIGQIAGKFGMAGDAIEGATGKMIGMGGAAGIAGAAVLGVAAAAAVYVGAMYGMAKAALFADEQTAKYNKTLMFIKGSLGNYQAQTDAVIKKSMELSKIIGEPYDSLAPIIAKATAKGADLTTATNFATLKTGMEKYGDAGKEVTTVLDQLVSGTKFGKNTADINKVQDALDRIGITKIKAIDIIKEKDAAKQLKMITANKTGIDNLAKELNAAVPVTVKFKNAFDVMLAKVFGAQGPNPINQLLDQLTKWMDDPSNIEKVQNFFRTFSEEVGKIDLSSFLNTLSAIIDKIDDMIYSAKIAVEVSKALAIGVANPGQIYQSGVAINKIMDDKKKADADKANKRNAKPAEKPIQFTPNVPADPLFYNPTNLGPTSSLSIPNYEAVKNNVSNTNNTTQNDNKFVINIPVTKDMDEQKLAVSIRKEIDKHIKDQTVVAGA